VLRGSQKTNTVSGTDISGLIAWLCAGRLTQMVKTQFAVQWEFLDRLRQVNELGKDPETVRKKIEVDTALIRFWV
jgi:hypothetical protein